MKAKPNKRFTERAANDKPLITVVSVEGNWDPDINFKRIKRAVSLFKSLNASFIVTAGTYEPNSTMNAPRLGAKNAQILMDSFALEPSSVIPSYHLPFEFTYTTIAAYGHACVLGWLASGFKKSDNPINIEFWPVSLGQHIRRVILLNERACQALQQLNVYVAVKCASLDENQLFSVLQNEGDKVSDILDPDGVVTTGLWKHGNSERCFDDVIQMQLTISDMFANSIPQLSAQQLLKLVDESSFSMRFTILRLMSHLSNSDTLMDEELIDRLINQSENQLSTQLSVIQRSFLKEYFKGQ